MCVTIKYKEEYFETVAELKSIALEIVKNEHYSDLDETSCLCQIDVEKTATKNGFTSQRSENCFYYIWIAL